MDIDYSQSHRVPGSDHSKWISMHVQLKMHVKPESTKVYMKNYYAIVYVGWWAGAIVLVMSRCVHWNAQYIP